MPNKLVGIVVEKLGLVAEGANEERIFLLKSKDEKEVVMPEPENVEEVAKTEEVVEKATDSSIEAMVRKMVTMVREMMGKKEDMPKDDMKKADAPTEETKPDPAIAELQKSNEELVKANEATKIELEKQAAELAKQKEDLAKAEVERKHQVYLEKAAGYDKLPVSKEDLAKHLQAIGDNVETLSFVEGLLKAANAAFADNVMFKEFGTSRIPEKTEMDEKVEKIQKDKGISYKDALLSLPQEEQNAYLAKRHGEVEPK